MLSRPRPVTNYGFAQMLATVSTAYPMRRGWSPISGFITYPGNIMSSSHHHIITSESVTVVASVTLTDHLWDTPSFGGVALDLRAADVQTRIFIFVLGCGDLFVLDAQRQVDGEWLHRQRYFPDRSRVTPPYPRSCRKPPRRSANTCKPAARLWACRSRERRSPTFRVETDSSTGPLRSASRCGCVPSSTGVRSSRSGAYSRMLRGRRPRPGSPASRSRTGRSTRRGGRRRARRSGTVEPRRAARTPDPSPASDFSDSRSAACLRSRIA